MACVLMGHLQYVCLQLYLGAGCAQDADVELTELGKDDSQSLPLSI